MVDVRLCQTVICCTARSRTAELLHCSDAAGRHLDYCIPADKEPVFCRCCPAAVPAAAPAPAAPDAAAVPVFVLLLCRTLLMLWLRLMLATSQTTW